MPSKIYFWLHGGLGDIIWRYINTTQWMWFQYIRETYPNSQIRAIIISYNDQAPEIIRFNPHIDEISFRFPNHEQKQGMSYKQIAAQYEYGYIPYYKLINENEIPPLEKQKIYLAGNHEKNYIKSITKNPYVFIHPFASEKNRQYLDPKDYIEIVDYIIDKMNMNVIVMGNDNFKIFGGKTILNQNERFNYNRKGLYNLTNKTNVRIATALARQCEYFIGTWSAYCVAAWTKNIPTITLLSPKARNGYRNILRGRDKQKVREYAKIIEGTTQSKVVKNTIKYLGNLK